MSMPLLSAGIFVFFVCYACLLTFLVVGGVSYSLVAFVFMPYCTFYGRFVGVGIFLICLLAVIHFVIGLLMLAFLQFICWPY